jgi:hypothetical protein
VLVGHKGRNYKTRFCRLKTTGYAAHAGGDRGFT